MRQRTDCILREVAGEFVLIPTGAAAAKTLLQRLDGDDSLPRRILFPTKLVLRDSV